MADRCWRRGSAWRSQAVPPAWLRRSPPPPRPPAQDGTGSATISGGNANDTITLNRVSGAATVDGAACNDTIVGPVAGEVTISGGSVDDQVSVRDAGDSVNGGTGSN